MAYRNADEILLVRNQELEAELSEAQATIRRLRGEDRPKSRSLVRVALGGTSQVDVVKRLPGKLDDDTISEVLERLSRRFDTSGEVARIGTRLTWSLPRTFEQTHNVDVSLTERAGAIDLVIRERVARFGVATYGLFWSLLLPFGLASAASLGHAPSLAIMAPLFALSILVARSAFRFWVQRRERAMQAVAEELAEALRASTARVAELPGVRLAQQPDCTNEAAREHEAELEANEALRASRRARDASE